MKDLATIATDFARIGRIAQARDDSQKQIDLLEAPYRARIRAIISDYHLSGIDNLVLSEEGITVDVSRWWQGQSNDDVEATFIPMRFFTEPDADKARGHYQAYLSDQKKLAEQARVEACRRELETNERAEYERLRAKFAAI